jgi:endoglucanase
MPSLRNAFITFVVALAAFAVPSAVAQAATFDPLGFHFASAVQTVNENAGEATITVTRTDTTQAAQVRYITIGQTAVAPYDYTPEKSMLSFAAGQASATFQVPVVDHGTDGLPKTIQVSLFGPSPIGMGTPSQMVLTILNNDPVAAVDPNNPLGLTTASVAGDDNPLAGARFYVSPTSEAAQAARSNPALDVIADQPGVARFGSFSYPNAAVSVANYLARAQVQQPGSIPMLTTYRIVDGHCGHWADPASDVASYEHFISSFAQAIGSYRAVLFLEQDSLITVGCLSPHGLAVRMQELNYAINVLKADCPHLVIYLDAGAADAVPAHQMAHLLQRAGVAKIQGFFLDATHFDWTSKEIKYGEEISRLTGGKHFVVNTGESGRGPLVPANRVKNGNEVLCNPAGRGLGPKPTASTGYPNVDAFAWLDNPGGSSGACVPGAPPAGHYWPAYALMLIQNANYAVK